MKKHVILALSAILLGVLIAGFWNYHFVDGIGKGFASQTIGEGASFGEDGAAFGILFALIAGLAATFTACNCVVFAMMPGLVCDAKKSLWKTLLAFITPVLVVGAVYGMFIGFLGPEGITLFNERAIRLAQAQAVFSALGIVLLIWGSIEFGFFRKVIDTFSPVTRHFFAQPNTKATGMGILVGLFAVGRPFPVFREFLTYAATAESPTYGALVMIVQGIGQIAVLLILLFLTHWIFGKRLANWSKTHPLSHKRIVAYALLVGGAYFLFYWGVAFLWNVGRWGFKLGIY